MDDKSYTCTGCEKYIQSRNGLRKHHQIHIYEKTYTCPDCEQYIPSKNGLRRHHQIHGWEIIQTPWNNISNITNLGNKHHQNELAKMFSLNTMTIVERALRVFPSLQKAVTMERIPPEPAVRVTPCCARQPRRLISGTGSPWSHTRYSQSPLRRLTLILTKIWIC